MVLSVTHPSIRYIRKMRRALTAIGHETESTPQQRTPVTALVFHCSDEQQGVYKEKEFQDNAKRVILPPHAESCGKGIEFANSGEFFRRLERIGSVLPDPRIPQIELERRLYYERIIEQVMSFYRDTDAYSWMEVRRIVKRYWTNEKFNKDPKYVVLDLLPEIYQRYVEKSHAAGGLNEFQIMEARIKSLCSGGGSALEAMNRDELKLEVTAMENRLKAEGHPVFVKLAVDRGEKLTTLSDHAVGDFEAYLATLLSKIPEGESSTTRR